MTLKPFALNKASPVATLSVLAATLALVIWTRHDALDTYWLQTKHSELGLSDLSDSQAWTAGPEFTNTLNKGLNEQQSQFDEIGSRMTLAANIVLNGPEVLERLHLTPARSVAKSAPNAQPLLNYLDELKLKPAQTAATAAAAAQAKGGATAGATIPAAAATALTTTAVSPTVAANDNEPKPDLPRLSQDGRIVLTSQDKVLLVGDSMMQGVAPHVARALQKANISSVDLSRQSTGLAYPTYFDWPATVQKAIPSSKITVMVVFMGANDTWDMLLGGRFERFGTEKWQSVYASRIDSMVKFAESQNVRVIWLGAPNMGREKINSGVKVLNQLYAAETNDGIARYVSTRELLGGGDTDIFQKHITKEDGKVVTVRTDDGVHFTRDGQVMLSNLILQQFAIPVPSKSS